MAKIKVQLRPSSIAGKRGSIYYHVSHKKCVRHITTTIRLLPEEWDGDKQRIVAADDEINPLQRRIDSDLTLLHRIVADLEAQQQPFTAEEIVARFRAPERYVSVASFFREQIGFLTDCNRLGTATNYRRAACTLAAFLEGRELRFSELTAQFVEHYNDYLQRKGLVRNSSSFHMRILRALYNKAVRRGYAEQTFPFRDVYTGIDRTRKRAVGEHVIRRLIQLDLTLRPTLAFARDLFLFSFYTRGMAFVDMVYLRKSDIEEGMIRYARHKTGQQLTIRVEPCIQAIIERYAEAAASTPYLFPILENDHAADCFQRYKNELRAYNARLTQLSRLLGADYHLSSYTSRHTWATMARNHNVPLSVISAGMGHTSERTTQIYLTSLENSLIDNANKGLLARFSAPRSR